MLDQRDIGWKFLSRQATALFDDAAWMGAVADLVDLESFDGIVVIHSGSSHSAIQTFSQYTHNSIANLPEICYLPRHKQHCANPPPHMREIKYAIEKESAGGPEKA